MALHELPSRQTAEIDHPALNGKEPTFEEFLPFVSFEGVEPAEAEKILKLLSDVYFVSSPFWRPGFCGNAPLMRAIIQPRLTLALPEAAVVAKHVPGYQHAWPEIVLPKTDAGFVVDPTGIPGALPYFGLIQHAQNVQAQEIYKKGTPFSR